MMKNNLIITVDIDLKNKNVYLAEETSSGAEYNYTDINDLADKIKFYLTNYYSDVIK